jgi:hypothetical protein
MIKFPKVVAAKLTMGEYELCQEVAREYYINRKIKAATNSELVRFALNEIFDKYLSNRTANNPANKEKIQETEQRTTGRQIKYRKVKKQSMPWLKLS